MSAPPDCINRSFNLPISLDEALAQVAHRRRTTKTALLVMALEDLFYKLERQEANRAKIRAKEVA